MVRPLLIAAAVVSLAAAALLAQPARAVSGSKQKPAPRVERRVPFAAGETLTYDVSWSSFVTAGTATLAVKEKKPSFGSVAYYIVAEGQPTPLLSKLYTLYYKMDTLVDVFSLLPQRASVFSQEGRRRRMKVTQFDQQARRAQYEVQTATLVRTTRAVPAYTQDPLAALYVLRTIPLKEGERMTMPIAESGTLYRITVTVGPRERVRTGLGTIDAWRVTPAIAGGAQGARGMVVWISTDDRRLPVRMETELAVGTFRLTLSSAAGVRAAGR